MSERRENRGIALVMVAVFLCVICAFAALGIDIARLAYIATQVQSIADAAARAGATMLMSNGGTAGTGITRAKFLASQNGVNGHFIDTTGNDPTEDVKVDERFYNFATNNFECCTTNGPCCANGTWGDLTCVGATRDCTKRAAVVAVPFSTPNNLFAGVFDFITVGGGLSANAATGAPNAKTKVQKLAVATPAGPAGGCQVPAGCAANDWGCYCDHGVAPCLPIAVPSCEFPPACSGSSCVLPTNLTVSSNPTDTAGWTGFGQTPNATTVRSFEAQGQCNPPGQPQVIPTQSVDDTITLNNGLDGAAQNQVFGLAQCLAGLGSAPLNQPQGCKIDPATGQIIPGQRGTVFQIPVFDSNDPTCTANFNQSNPIVGFATISITGVSLGNPRTITIDTINNTSNTGERAAGQCLGTDCKLTMAR